MTGPVDVVAELQAAVDWYLEVTRPPDEQLPIAPTDRAAVEETISAWEGLIAPLELP